MTNTRTQEVNPGAAAALRSRPVTSLEGSVRAPGDKSISHRALILGSMADGVTAITDPLQGDDTLRTAAAMRMLGADVEQEKGCWRVTGAKWQAPARPLYFGNSGTGARLAMGAVAGFGIAASFDGDQSLRARPMGRVLEPLRMMGLEASSKDGRLPVSLTGAGPLKAIECKLATASAQVKSAILLAALNAKGKTRIHEPVLCRDHTERMLNAFGVNLTITPDNDRGRFVEIEGGQRLTACGITVPGDPSSAAFLIAAALITPGADITVENVLTNPGRIGFYETLQGMGADIVFENKRDAGGEPVADIRARHSVLYGVEVPPERAASMIDEYPILSIVAAFANGETMMRGLEELRVKESDRIASVEAGLASCGVDAASGPNWLRIRGSGSIKGGARVKTNHDHRIAMSFLALGCASDKSVEIDDASMIATSFPGFTDVMTKLGASIEPA